MDEYAAQVAEGRAPLEPGLMHIALASAAPNVAGDQQAPPADDATPDPPARGDVEGMDLDHVGHTRTGSGRSKSRLGPLLCQVDTCRAPLNGLKEYHQRYKVCERHLKIEYIERDGAKVRFCQQCGRFQHLDEFDDNKRSCRARLQRHNARRRQRSRGGHSLEGPDDVAAAMGVDDMAAVQEAIQFASATLMHTTATGGSAGQQGGEQDPASAAAAIAGLPFGGGLTAMPYVPSPQVMLLLLKGYAGMFHYVLEDVQLRPLAEPTPTSMHAAVPQADANAMAAAAAAAAMAAAGGGAPDHEAAVAQFMAMQAGGVAGPFMDAAAAAAAMAGHAVADAEHQHHEQQREVAEENGAEGGAAGEQQAEDGDAATESGKGGGDEPAGGAQLEQQD